MKIVKLFRSKTHSVVKYECESLTMVKDLGVLNDAHFGKKMKHRYLARLNPEMPNLRQVHLISKDYYSLISESFKTLNYGELGENILVDNYKIDQIYKKTILKIGHVELEVTGYRLPCRVMDKVYDGLFRSLKNTSLMGSEIIPVGLMAVVLNGGEVKVNDPIVRINPKLKIPLNEV